MHKWIVLVGILLWVQTGFAQSDPYVDTTITTTEDTIIAEDSFFTESDKEPDSMILRSTPDTTILHLQKQKEFAYANDPEYWKKKKKRVQSPAFLSTVFKYLLLGLFIVVLLYLVFNILTTNKILLFKSIRKWKEGSAEEELSQQADLSSLIAIAEQNQEFRLAARYHYLKVLEELNARQLIRTHVELTNWDYVKQLASHPLNTKFRYLTTAYEYVWYGEFQLSAQQYRVLKNKFESFI